MKATYRNDEKAVWLEFDTVDAVESFFDGVKEQHGFFLELDRKLELYQGVAFVALALPRFDFEFEAEVIQVLPRAEGYGVAFQLRWHPGQSKELHDKLHGGATE